MGSEVTVGKRTFALSLRLTNRAARSAVQLLSEEAGDQLLEDRDLRDEALVLLHALFGNGKGGLYRFELQNGGQGREGDGLVNLWLTPDGGGTAENAAVLRRLNGWPLVLMGASQPRRYGEDGTDFLVIDLVALPPWSVDAVADAVPTEIAFDWDGRFASGIPAEIYRGLQRLPVHRLQRDRVRLLLDDWGRFLRVRQRIAEAARFSLEYVGYRLDEAGQRARFQVVLPDLPDGADGADAFDPHKVRQAKGEDLHLDLTPEEERVARALARARGEPVTDRDGPGEVLGEIEKLQGSWLEIRLDRQIAGQIRAGRRDLPKKGRLQYRAIGELAQVRRLRWGLESLLRGRASNHRLGEFLFDPNEAALPFEVEVEPLAPDDLLQPHLNAGQLRAVAGALSAPDLYLIQGPPGTGKTTVIAEICYQVAKRGGRTMVASQANLAVDNAMSKLVHDPLIRALRRGRAESVEEEGQPYLEDYVIGTWLDKIGADCQGDLDARTERAQMLAELLEIGPAVAAFDAARARYQSESRERRAAAEAAAAACAEARAAQTAVEAHVRVLEDVSAALNAVLAADGGSARAAGAPAASEPVPEDIEDASHAASPPPLALIAEDDLSPLLDLERAIARWRAPQPAHGEESAAGADAIARQGTTAPSAAASLPTATAACFVSDYVQRCRVAHESADRIRDGCAETAPKIEALGLLCRSWYELLDEAAPLLERQRARLAGPRARQARIAELAERLPEQKCELAEMKALLGEMNQIHRGLASWLLRRATVDRELDAVPPAFQSAERRPFWAAALGDQRLPTLRGVAAKARRNRDAAETLGRMVAQIERCVARLRAEVSPRHLAAAARQPPDWRATTLADLVEPGPEGLLCPAATAEAELAPVLQTTLTRARATESRVRLTEQRVAVNIIGLQALADDLRVNQRHLAALSQRQFQDFRTVVNQLAAGLAADLRAQFLMGQRELTARLQANQQELADLQRQALAEERGHSEEDERLAALQREQEAVAQAIRVGLGTPETAQMLPLHAVEAAALDALSSGFEDWAVTWQAALDDLDGARTAVDGAAAALDPDAVLSVWQRRADDAAASAGARLVAAECAVEAAAAAVADAEAEVAALASDFTAAREAWLAAYEALPEAVRPEMQSATSTATLDALRERCIDWEAEYQALQAYLDSYQPFISDWIDRVSSRNAQDEADLRQIYIDNANVIGITCVQAGGRAFSQRYRDFDTVIIDEVSKATPPELLLPMLKGAKIVLVGDSRQLPPMIGAEALQDLAETLGIETRDLAGRQGQSHLERSLFRELFERAPSGLKSWLTDQYRMHPQIMDAINQFYHDKLACQIPEPDVTRAHGLAPLIPESTHIAWIPTPWSEPFYETRVGTSRRNDQEIDIIANLVEQMDAVWGRRAAGGTPKAVGVITFYAAQENALRARLLGRGSASRGARRYANLDLRLGTVDRFQGMEKPVIIVSLVCNNARRDIGFARALERINVAFSRAQELLVIVGSRELFCRRAAAARAAERYARVAEVVQRNGGMLNVADFVSR